MKKLLLLLVLAVYSCSPEPMEDSPVQLKEVQQCGTIMKLEDSPDGDKIYVRMPYHNAAQRDVYAVSNYSDYRLGQEICIFDQLIKIESY